MRTGRVVGILAIGLAGSAMGQTFSILNDYSDMEVQRLVTFDNLTVGQVLTPGDLIEAGISFGDGFGIAEALVIDQGGGDLALQMTIIENTTRVSGISIASDLDYSAVVATWQRVSGLNNFDGGLGNPGINLFESDGSYITGASQSPTTSPYNNTPYARGYGSDDGGSFAEALFELSNSSSDSIWIIDDVAFGVIPTPGAAAVFGIAGLGLARRRR